MNHALSHRLYIAFIHQKAGLPVYDGILNAGMTRCYYGKA